MDDIHSHSYSFLGQRNKMQRIVLAKEESIHYQRLKQAEQRRKQEQLFEHYLRQYYIRQRNG